MTPVEVLQFGKENGARQIEVRFSFACTLGSFHEGLGIDGSSIGGWAVIKEIDMLPIPDSTKLFMDHSAMTTAGAAVCGRRLCGAQPHGAVLQPYAAEARAGACGHRSANCQQLQTSLARYEAPMNLVYSRLYEFSLYDDI